MPHMRALASIAVEAGQLCGLTEEQINVFDVEQLLKITYMLVLNWKNTTNFKELKGDASLNKKASVLIASKAANLECFANKSEDWLRNICLEYGADPEKIAVANMFSVLAPIPYEKVKGGEWEREPLSLAKCCPSQEAADYFCCIGRPGCWPIDRSNFQPGSFIPLQAR